MDKFAVMRAFCRIVERGSFTRAAEDLNVSSALLSRQVKLLEQNLDCRLLTRTTRSMSLTHEGRHYFEEARAILEAVDQAETRLHSRFGGVRGTLRINAPNSYGQLVLAPLLPSFLAAHPELKISLSMDDRLVDMIEGGHDLSIRIRPCLPDSALVARPIAEIKQQLFASPTYLFEKGRPTSPADLAHHATVGYLLSKERNSWPLQDPSGLQTTVLCEPRLQVGSSLVLCQALIDGLGIGALPDFISSVPLARGALARVLPGFELPPRYVFAVTSSRLGMNAKVRAFLNHVCAALAPALSTHGKK